MNEPTHWTKIKKGSAHIWKHPDLAQAVVDRRCCGMLTGITYQGEYYPSVEEAKRAALKGLTLKI